MSDAATTSLLQLHAVEENRYRVPQPSEAAEGRDVVFSGQLIAQSIMATAVETSRTKHVNSVQSVFCRAGSYATPLELSVEPMQHGRTWSSDTVSATQTDKLLARFLVLSSVEDPDLVRHGPPMPAVRGPDDGGPAHAIVFPGAQALGAPLLGSGGDGPPTSAFWHRYPEPVDDPAANAAILSWATCGQLIGLAFAAHPGAVDIADAHRTISTGVIGHTVNFLETIDVSQWLLVCEEATYAGRGRVHGRGMVFDEDGRLVATYSQVSMARRVDGALDPRRSM